MEIRTLSGFTMKAALAKMQEVLPQDAYKKVPGAANLTDISPAYRAEVVSEVFGMCGIGWWFEFSIAAGDIEYIEKKGSNGPYFRWKVLIKDFKLFYSYVIGDQQYVSAPIPATGENENAERGYAIKGAITTCQGAAFSHLLWQLSVYKNNLDHRNAGQKLAEQQRANLPIWQTWACGNDVMAFGQTLNWNPAAAKARLAELGPFGMNLAEQYYQILTTEPSRTTPPVVAETPATPVDVAQSAPQPVAVGSNGAQKVTDPVWDPAANAPVDEYEYLTNWQELSDWLVEKDIDPAKALIAVQDKGGGYSKDRVAEHHKFLIQHYNIQI
jgi:hypothetical protein